MRYVATFCMLWACCSILFSQITLDHNYNVGIGNENPAEKLHVQGHITLSSPESGDEDFQNRFHTIYGQSGKKGVFLGSDKNSSDSWAYISLRGDGSCLSCQSEKKGDVVIAGRTLQFRSGKTNSSYGDLAVRIHSNMDLTSYGNLYCEKNLGVKTSSPLADIHIKDFGNPSSIILERTDHGNYVNLISGSTGNSFLFAREKRFAIGSTSNVTSTSTTAAHSIYFYGSQWSVTTQRSKLGVATLSPNERLHVNGNVKAASFIVSSDRRLKSNVRDFNHGLDAVLSLQPIRFSYNGRASTIEGDEHIGLVAQELQRIAPELVEEFTHVNYEINEDGEQIKTGEETYLQIRDSEVKYLLFNAIKEQQSIIDDKSKQIVQLEEKLNELASKVEQLYGANDKQGQTELEQNINELDIELMGEVGIFLGQNAPNPFKESTVIEYAISIPFSKAELRFNDMNGKVIHVERIVKTGEGRVNLKTTNLLAGQYSYCLIVDENLSDCKTMMLSK